MYCRSTKRSKLISSLVTPIQHSTSYDPTHLGDSYFEVGRSGTSYGEFAFIQSVNYNFIFLSIHVLVTCKYLKLRKNIKIYLTFPVSSFPFLSKNFLRQTAPSSVVKHIPGFYRCRRSFLSRSIRCHRLTFFREPMAVRSLAFSSWCLKGTTQRDAVHQIDLY